MVVVLIVLALAFSQARPNSGLRVVFLDVGQGDCAFVTTASGKTILIDGGGKPAEDEDTIGMKIVEPFLRSQGVNRIDMIVLSHPHDDHIRGLLCVLHDFRVGSVIEPHIPHNSKSYREFLKIVRERNITYRIAVRGQRIDFGDGTSAEVLNPPMPKLNGTRDDVNNNSCVIRFKYRGRSVLFTGDAGIEAEKDILSTGRALGSDVIKIGHHGSSTATGAEFLDAVHPKIAVISVGKYNHFGHPCPSIVRRLLDRGIKVYRTDRDGSLVMEITGRKTVIQRVMR